MLIGLEIVLIPFLLHQSLPLNIPMVNMPLVSPLKFFTELCQCQQEERHLTYDSLPIIMP